MQEPEKPHHLTLISSKFDFEIPTFEKKFEFKKNHIKSEN